MASYKLAIRRSAAKEIEAISPASERKRVVQAIQSLADVPRPPGCKKLSGSERYRVRQGRFRILYEIEDSVLTVVIVKVAHRREAYR